ncbi:putative ABC transporter ATP-binding protein YxlF [compost metagenome]
MSVKVKNLSKYYDGQAVVDNISFEAKAGRILGFLGPNGAGKSTTMGILTGYLAATSGEVEVAGVLVSPQAIAAKREIGYLPENTPLYNEMYVSEFLTFVGETYKLKKIKQRVEEVIKQVGLDNERHKKIHMLSKGYKQRVGLAQAIIHQPQVLILDEPTSGLDPNQLIDIRILIKSLGSHQTIIISTHIMQEVEAICDDMIIIDKGRIVANDTLQSLKDKHKGLSLEEIFKQLTQN